VAAALQGVPAELRIGVRTQEGFSAHAWVEVGGQPVNDAPDVAERFAPFDDSLSARFSFVAMSGSSCWIRSLWPLTGPSMVCWPGG